MKLYGQDYADNIDAPTKHTIIPNSTHPFTEDGVMEDLFKESVAWIKEQISSSSA
jgi:hypothetical protein